MPFASVLCTTGETTAAVKDVCRLAEAQLPGPADLAMMFYSPHHCAELESLAQNVQERLQPRCLLGCPGETVVSNDREIETGPVLGLWLAKWGRPVEVTPFHLVVEETSEGYSLLGWPDNLHSADPKQSVLLLLADPFTFPVDDFLRQVNEEYPGLRVMGGMASGGRQPGENPMLLGQQAMDQGAVGVLVQGPATIRSVVSQGCRPIGRHMVITKAQENIIIELGGKPPLAQLQELWQTLSPKDQELVRRGLHIGRVINEYQGEFQRGDFLIRNVMEIDQQSGALAVTERVRVGQTVQFHVRDAATADEDLQQLLQFEQRAHAGKPAGALLLSCNGRGTRLFDKPDHDARTIRNAIGAVPLAGFFAQGELGPVGGQNFIHGFTASVVLFEE
jgi:small ligand-binding sensory domain FIST